MNIIKIKVRDLQFPRYFLLNEIDLSNDRVKEFLNFDIEIVKNGEPDTTVLRNNTLIIQNPSSITRFLFNVLYGVLSTLVTNGVYRDKLGLGLLFTCKRYVYENYNTQCCEGTKNIPVLIQSDKMCVPTMIIRELVEPLVGDIPEIQILYYPCRFTDVCRPITHYEQLTRQYDLPRMPVSGYEFPIILLNTNIHNKAADAADLTVTMLEMALGREKSHKVTKNILLGGDGGLVSNLVTILKTLEGDPQFVLDFLDFFETSVFLTGEEELLSLQLQKSIIQSDSYLKKHMKVAADSNSNRQVFKQWSQWSMLMGLIEKQLGPMRGSMWPTTESVKPFEDRFRRFQRERAKEKNKNELNFEELLETYRDIHAYKAIEPGNIVEHMLKDKRVWKV